jgi:TonB family protein
LTRVQASLNNAGMKAKQVMLTTVLLLVSVAYAQQPDSPRPERIRVSNGIAEGQITHRVPPVYPEEAKKNLIQGDVVLTATISKEGDIIDLKVVSGHPLLADASTEAVKHGNTVPTS